MKKTLSLLTSIMMASMVNSITAFAENDTDTVSYSDIVNMTDEQFAEFTNNIYSEYGYGDDSIDDENKFREYLNTVPDFFSGDPDAYISEKYHAYKVFSSGEAEAYMSFIVDTETELNNQLLPSALGYPDEWIIKCTEGKWIIDQDVYSDIHEYRLYIPKDIISDFEEYIKLEESFRHLSTDLLNEYDITARSWIGNQFIPRGEGIEILNGEEGYIKGDANGDGKLNLNDAVAILQYVALPAKYPLTGLRKINADCDGVDGISGGDALWVQQKDAGLF